MEKKLPIFTDLKITPKDTQSVKRYFNSLSRNLPKGWQVNNNTIDDSKTLRIVYDQICLCLPKFEDIQSQQITSASLYLGLTIDSIMLMHVQFDIDIEKEASLEMTGYVLHSLHEYVLKTNKHYTSFNHDFKFGGPLDENWHKVDIRDTRAIKIHSKSENATYFLTKNTNAKSGDKEISYSAPNSISISLNITKRAIKRALAIYKQLISKSKESNINIGIDNSSELYDYFEEIQTSIIFSYVAVESFANATIPKDFTFEKFNEKGIKEIWNKTNIERWISTSEKVSTIIPKVLDSSDVKQESFWNHFKELEKLRNDIVHQKTNEDESMLEAEIFNKMLNNNIFTIIQSSFAVIDFFYKLDNAHPYFPLGLGIAKFKVTEIESMAAHFKLVDKDSQV